MTEQTCAIVIDWLGLTGAIALIALLLASGSVLIRNEWRTGLRLLPGLRVLAFGLVLLVAVTTRIVYVHHASGCASPNAAPVGGDGFLYQFRYFHLFVSLWAFLLLALLLIALDTVRLGRGGPIVLPLLFIVAVAGLFFYDLSGYWQHLYSIDFGPIPIG